MMKLFVVAVLVSCVLVGQTRGDIASIISGLNEEALRVLKGVTVPVLNAEIGVVRRHVQQLVSFFKGQEGEINIPNTPFKIHFTAERCHLGIGKRLLLVDFQTCKAEASEDSIGLTAKCEKGSQTDAIECATDQVLNLLKAITAAIQKSKDKNKGD